MRERTVRDALPSAPRVGRLRRQDRLYLRIYFALLAGLLLVGSLLWGFWYWEGYRRGSVAFEAYADLASRVLPPATAPADLQLEALQMWAQGMEAQLTLYRSDRTLIAHAGKMLPAPSAEQARSGWLVRESGMAALKLADGRWLVGRKASLIYNGPLKAAAVLALIALVVSMGAYPVARRLTQRLEKLQVSVDALGAGDLKARVEVEGSDEVAHLARSFNQAAARIEAAVVSQKALLANASHELRSPLARMRMAIELGTQPGDPGDLERRRKKIGEELRRNIVELDEIIDEILLASRLEANALSPALTVEEVDLTALVAEECARVGAEFSGVQAELRGDSRLLRRLVRNLLENGRRHGSGSPIEVSLNTEGTKTVRLDVCDRGAGIPEDLRERIFEPFFRVPGTRESDGGVGLGLALVRTIAEHHKGRVSCEARAGGGSRFSLVLPLA